MTRPTESLSMTVRSWAALTALALAGCAGTPAVAPEAPTPQAPTIQVSAPAPGATPRAPGLRTLDGHVVFSGPAPASFDVQAFALGRPGQVISAGGGNVVSAGGANVISAGGGNVVSAGGMNYAIAQTTGTEGTFHLPVPDGVAAGTLVKLVVTAGDQTLAAVVQVPEADTRRVAQAEADKNKAPIPVTLATTLAYVMLSQRLEGAGQAMLSLPGSTSAQLATTATTAYQSIAGHLAAIFDAPGAGNGPTVSAIAQAATDAMTSPAPIPTLPREAGNRVLQVAPGIANAFVNAVEKLNKGIETAVSQGAKRPDNGLLGPMGLGSSVGLGSILTGGGSAGPNPPPPAEAGSGVSVSDGEIKQPTGKPTVTSQP
jgi:hypothetical protein